MSSCPTASSPPSGPQGHWRTLCELFYYGHCFHCESLLSGYWQPTLPYGLYLINPPSHLCVLTRQPSQTAVLSAVNLCNGATTDKRSGCNLPKDPQTAYVHLCPLFSTSCLSFFLSILPPTHLHVPTGVIVILQLSYCQ